MGILDHLWDDTVAGPRPENGLGKLRKHHTFSFRPSSGNDQSDGGDSPEEALKVTRSIMIIKPPGYQGGSAPVSPAGSTPPVSPFSEFVGASVEEYCRIALLKSGGGAATVREKKGTACVFFLQKNRFYFCHWMIN
ncbi:dormancy-associated protein homolog 3-like isoform X2 [Brassica napus]|uniref:dormancy-associated protein homolog 3-like isoform X2 n=1 Tax=Brassica napus TaxID=3708 RepID=UPI002079A305|nr:dormancy-associated protein homolog 3-like isoform X2 [Brassica napus]